MNVIIECWARRRIHNEEPALSVGRARGIWGRRIFVRPWIPRVVVCLGLFVMTGCAALPIPFSPQTQQQNSNWAEGTFIALDTIDTLQTVQIAKHPQCWREADPMAAKIYGTDHPSAGAVVGINFALMIAHTMVASWLDDEVAKHDMANDGSVGPWYVGRIAFHTVSILYSGAAVLHNKGLGISPLGGGC